MIARTLTATLIVGLISCGTDPDPSPTPAQTPSPVTDPCTNEDPITVLVKELRAYPLLKSKCQARLIMPGDREWCDQMDASGGLYSIPVYDYHAGVIEQAKAHAGIAQGVSIFPTVDLLNAVGSGGGITGSTAIVLDGKLLDIFSEYANFRAAQDLGRTTMDRVTALNSIVANHNAVPQATARPRLFATAPTGGIDVAAQYQLDYSAAIIYHEFGHLWAWACENKMVQQFSSQWFQPYPALAESDADFIAGALTAKAGHDLSRAQEAFDIMTFQFLNRKFGTRSILDVELSYDQQYRSSNPAYESLAGRKSLVRAGHRKYVDLLATPMIEVPLPAKLSCGVQSYSCGMDGYVAGCCMGAAHQCSGDHPVLCAYTNTCTTHPANCGGPACFFATQCGP